MTNTSPPRTEAAGTRAAPTRRAVLSLLGTGFLAGCVSSGPQPSLAPAPPPPPPAVPPIYEALNYERFPIPAVDVSRIDPVFWRAEDVLYRSDERIGTVVVDTAAKYLYHVTGPDRADRYGIGVGRDGFSWQGRANIAYKREWPRWTPPDEMVARQPELEPYSIANGGMDPGPENPLGARALYIFQNGVDTIFRVHGTHQSWSIGRAVSSGCIRLLNHDIIHLHQRVRDGSSIVVLHDGSTELMASA